MTNTQRVPAILSFHNPFRRRPQPVAPPQLTDGATEMDVAKHCMLWLETIQPHQACRVWETLRPILAERLEQIEEYSAAQQD